MKTDNPDHFVTPKLFEQIVQSRHHLIAIETATTADIVLQFRQLALRGGQSIYLWQGDSGIVSLREGDVRVPGSKRMTDALRYILQSMQFGVYLFTDFVEHLRPPNTGLLRQISRIRTGHERKVIFIGEPVPLPDGLEELIERIKHHSLASGNPRLRDGRWVV